MITTSNLISETSQTTHVTNQVSIFGHFDFIFAGQIYSVNKKLNICFFQPDFIRTFNSHINVKFT